jgi:Tfp pilus assembly protein PilO
VKGHTPPHKEHPAQHGQLDALKKAIPDSPQLDTVISTIDTAATQSAVDLQALAPTPIAAAPATSAPAASGGAASPASQVTELKFTLSAAGSYSQLMDFTHRISTTPRLIVVDSLSLGAEKDGKQSANISGRMFTLNPASTAATSAGAK